MAQRSKTLNFENAVDQAAVMRELIDRWLTWGDSLQRDLSMQRLQSLLTDLRAFKKELREFGYNPVYGSWLIKVEQLVRMLDRHVSEWIKLHESGATSAPEYLVKLSSASSFYYHHKYLEVARLANSRFSDKLAQPFVYPDYMIQHTGPHANVLNS